MQKYRCHKIVEAADLGGKNVLLDFEVPGGHVGVSLPDGTKLMIPANVINSQTPEEIEDGYVVKYEDGHISWSPRKTFEDGYAAIPPDAK